LVNNAGILRDRMMVNMEEFEWDAVIKVHLKGTFAPARHAAAYWRDLSKAGDVVDAAIVNTSSSSGLFGNVGQSNYVAAKAGIAALTIAASTELARYGVRVNAIAPVAMTRMTEGLKSLEALSAKSDDGWERVDAANISPLVVWLASREARGVTGRVFSVLGGMVRVEEGWIGGPSVDIGRKWDPAELTDVVPDLVRRAASNANTRGLREM
jgi:NAD(P)-dependent dehydrogenase (short-subunit alcohol dehydrogenase family)